VYILVIDGESPVHLLHTRGAVKIARVGVQVEGAFEPALVERSPVSVPRLDDVPRVIQLFEQLGVFDQGAREIFQHHRADRLVGVWAAQQERVLGAGADLQAVERSPGASLSDLRNRYFLGVLRRQLVAVGVHFCDGVEHFIVGHIGKNSIERADGEHSVAFFNEGCLKNDPIGLSRQPF
jgi:hypothetical protein